MIETVLRELRQAWLWPMAHLACVMGLSLGLLLAQGGGAPGGLTVAVYPPWWSEARAIGAVAGAGAPVAARGPVGFMVVTVAEHGTMAQRLRAGGAIALLNPMAARLCGA